MNWNNVINLSQRLINLCESIEDQEGRNKIFLKTEEDYFIVDTTLANSDHNALILNKINDLIEGGNWNKLGTKPSDNMFITEYRTANGKLREYRSNVKKFSDMFEFTDEAEAREFFEEISVDIDDKSDESNPEEEEDQTVEFNDEGTPEEFSQEDIDAAEQDLANSL